MGKLAWLLCILATWVIVNGGTEAPPPAISCANAPFGRLRDCLTFVENGSTVSKPEGSCCSSLKGVVKDSQLCLCEALKTGSSDFGIALNITKAFALPSACGISTPAFNSCALGVGGASPSPSPSIPSPKMNPYVPSSPLPLPPLGNPPASSSPPATAKPPSPTAADFSPPATATPPSPTAADVSPPATATPPSPTAADFSPPASGAFALLIPCTFSLFLSAVVAAFACI